MEFKIGDKVIGRGEQSGLNITGMIGTVITPLHEKHYGVEFEKPNSKFHNCDKYGQNGYCYYILPTKLTLINKPEPGIQIVSPGIISSMDNSYQSNFKIGDRVMGIGNQDGINIHYRTGTIKSIKSFGVMSVEFDTMSTDFHTCNGHCKSHHGLNVNTKNLKLLNQHPQTCVNISHAPVQAASGGGFVNVISGQPSIPASCYSGFGDSGSSGTIFQSIGGYSPIGGYTQYKPQEWTITETPPPSPYIHKEASYVGKAQQFNAIIHNKQIDEFLLLN